MLIICAICSLSVMYPTDLAEQYDNNRHEWAEQASEREKCLEFEVSDKLTIVDELGCKLLRYEEQVTPPGINISY